MPHTYTRALPSNGTRLRPIRTAGEAPRSACSDIDRAVVRVAAGETGPVRSDAHSRHVTPVSRIVLILPSVGCRTRRRASPRTDEEAGRADDAASPAGGEVVEDPLVVAGKRTGARAQRDVQEDVSSRDVTALLEERPSQRHRDTGAGLGA